MGLLEGYEPKEVWSFFEEFSQIKETFAMDFDIVKRLIRAGALLMLILTT